MSDRRYAIPASGHLPALDGLRGVAILSVIVFHFTRQPDATWLDALYTGVAKSGWLGVDLFFVLSGFLITRILLATKAKPHYFRNFYARRALRIFPVYYLYLLGVTVLLPLLLPGDADVARYADNAPWHWAYLSNVLRVVEGEGGANTHLWSLAVEEQFYLLWPLLVLTLSRWGLFKACMAMIAGAFLFRVAGAVALDSAGTVAWVGLLPSRVDALASGAVLALVVSDPDVLDWLAPAARYVFALGVLALLALGVPAGQLDQRMAITATLGLSVLAATCAAFLVLVLTAPPGSLLARASHSRFLTAIGRVSYCMYVVHIITGDIVARLLGDVRLPGVMGSRVPADLVLIAAGTLATYSIAWASWYLYERHWLTLKERFENRAPVPETTGVLAHVQPGS